MTASVGTATSSNETVTNTKPQVGSLPLVRASLTEDELRSLICNALDQEQQTQLLDRLNIEPLPMQSSNNNIPGYINQHEQYPLSHHQTSSVGTIWNQQSVHPSSSTSEATTFATDIRHHSTSLPPPHSQQSLQPHVHSHSNAQHFPSISFSQYSPHHVQHQHVEHSSWKDGPVTSKFSSETEIKRIPLTAHESIGRKLPSTESIFRMKHQAFSPSEKRGNTTNGVLSLPKQSDVENSVDEKKAIMKISGKRSSPFQDSSDTVEQEPLNLDDCRRQKNRERVRKCRRRKQDKLEQLSSRVQQLEHENLHLHLHLSSLTKPPNQSLQLATLQRFQQAINHGNGAISLAATAIWMPNAELHCQWFGGIAIKGRDTMIMLHEKDQFISSIVSSLHIENVKALFVKKLPEQNLYTDPPVQVSYSIRIAFHTKESHKKKQKARNEYRNKILSSTINSTDGIPCDATISTGDGFNPKGSTVKSYDDSLLNKLLMHYAGRTCILSGTSFITFDGDKIVHEVRNVDCTSLISEMLAGGI